MLTTSTITTDRYELLEALYCATDHRSRIAHDPVRFVHRYDHVDDQEIAGFISAGFAFGSVRLFLPVLDDVFARLDSLGGPAHAVRAFGREAERLMTPITYRWIKAGDLSALLAGLSRTLAQSGSLEALLAGEGPLATRLTQLVDTVRSDVLAASGQACLTRGTQTFLPSPRDKSACKRLNLWLRWMVRPAREGVDLGVYNAITPAELIIPLDVHVGRFARFLGLTTRTDTSWRTAEEITDHLRVYDPQDPVRFDFALAHLGISGACVGHRHVDVCPSCPLDPICLAPSVESEADRAIVRVSR